MRVAPVAAAALVAALALAGPAGAADRARPDPPNIVLVVTDDQTLASYTPEVMPRTAELLEGTGTRFTNAFVTSPLCCPSRATMLTGQYGHNNGVLRNEYGPLVEKTNTLPVWLQEAGYRTMHLGRYLNFYEPVTEPHEVAPGWDDWRTITGGSDYFDYEIEVGDHAVPYGSEDGDYVTRVINARAEHMIESAAHGDQPFYLQVDHIAPHQASGTRAVGCKSSPIPDPRDRHRFRDLELPTPPSLNEADVADKPSFIQALPPLDESDMRRATRRYRCTLASLRAVDRGVGGIFEALEEAGELDDTVVLFLSDNGYYFGEHRIPDKKHNPYEEGIRVPFLVRLPKALRDGAPRQPVLHQTVANIDIAPTILQLAGAEPCRPSGSCRALDGRSLLPLLRGRGRSWPAERDLLIELARVGTPSDVGGRACAYSGIRTISPAGGSIFYVEHTSAVGASGACEPVDERELYDLAGDPWQLDNLAYSGRPPGLLEEDPRSPFERAVAARLDELRDCAGLPARDPVPDSGHYCE
ncbi:MAG TPA: sulfatase [Solirubrobacterales bacterium]